MLPVYVVRKLAEGQPVEILSAWSDIYAAKFEARRWEQDLKIPHDFVEGVLVLAPHTVLA